MASNDVELPDGYSAWTAGGQPVRRVATNGNAQTLRGFAEGLTLEQLTWAQRDMAIYGDAWMAMDGGRVSPFDVFILEPGIAAPVKYRPDDYPRAPWDDKAEESH